LASASPSPEYTTILLGVLTNENVRGCDTGVTVNAVTVRTIWNNTTRSNPAAERVDDFAFIVGFAFIVV